MRLTEIMDRIAENCVLNNLYWEDIRLYSPAYICGFHSCQGTTRVLLIVLVWTIRNFCLVALPKFCFSFPGFFATPSHENCIWAPPKLAKNSHSLSSI